MGKVVQYRVEGVLCCFKHAVEAAVLGKYVESEVVDRLVCDLDVKTEVIWVYKNEADKSIITEQVINAETKEIIAEKDEVKEVRDAKAELEV